MKTKTPILPGAIAPPAGPAPSPDVQTPSGDKPEIRRAIEELAESQVQPHPRRNWMINDVTRTSRAVKNASPDIRAASLVFRRDMEMIAIFPIANLVSAVSDAPEQAAAQPEGGAAA